jgi:hypothetical protein
MHVSVLSVSVERSKHCSGRQFSWLAVYKSLPRHPKHGLGHIVLVLVSPSLLSKLSALTDISALPVTYDWLSHVLIRMVNDVGHESPHKSVTNKHECCKSAIGVGCRWSEASPNYQKGFFSPHEF